MVATTHKGSLACAAAAAPAGQGQVAPRGCGTHGLDGLGLSGLRCTGACSGLLWACCGFAGSGNGQKQAPPPQTTALSQRSTLNGIADSRSRNVAQRRGDGENGTGGLGPGAGGVRKGCECNRRERKKNTIGRMRNRLWFCLLAKFLLLCCASNALLACAAALQLAHLVRSDGQGLGALYDGCSQPETAK